jgi:hypothetical protein
MISIGKGSKPVMILYSDITYFNNIICPVDTNISVNLLKTVNMGILY